MKEFLDKFKKKYHLHILSILIVFAMALFIRCGFPFKKTLLVKLYKQTGAGGTTGSTQTGSTAYQNLCPNPDEGDLQSVMVSKNGNIVYIGGPFTTIGTCSGGGLIYDLPSGDLTYDMNETSFPMVHGEVKVAISDGTGGFYVGGDFDAVGSSARNNIAHIDLNGNLTSFAPNINDDVNSLALSSDGSILYIGGEFTDINGSTRNALAAVNTADGTLIGGFNPDIYMAANPRVDVLVLSSDDATLYFGGWFSKVGGAGGTNRNYIAAVNTVDGLIVGGFDPNANSTVIALALSSDDAKLYVGGFFTTIAANGRNRIAAVNTVDGTIVAAFNPDADSFVSSFALTNDDSTLYLGGAFTTVGGSPRNYVAAVSTSNGTAVSTFNPNSQNVVSTMALSTDESSLYMGGDFSTVGATTRMFIAAVNTADGSVVSGFNPGANYQVFSVAVNSTGSTLYLGGSFSVANNVTKNKLAAIDTTEGSLITAFEINANDKVNCMAFSNDGTVIYLGGDFTTIQGSGRNRVAAVNASDGSLISGFNPGADDDVDDCVLSNDGSKLYLSGRFDNVAGNAREKIAAVNTSDGSIVTGFNPGAIGCCWIASLAIKSDDSILYVGGDFSSIGGVGRNDIAGLDTTDGSVVGTFNPNSSNAVRSIALSSDDSILYVGGHFTSIGGAPRNRIAAIDTSNGTVVGTFNPNASSTVYSLLLTGDDSILYMGGTFTTVGGDTRNRIAAVDTSDGSLIAGFNPGTDGIPYFLALNPDDSTLYIIGSFSTVASQTRTGFAAVNTSDGSLVSSLWKNIKEKVEWLASLFQKIINQIYSSIFNNKDKSEEKEEWIVARRGSSI